MRTFAAFMSLGFLAFALILLQDVGGWKLFWGAILLVLAIHLEIGLRTDEVESRLLRIMRLIEQSIGGRVG